MSGISAQLLARFPLAASSSSPVEVGVVGAGGIARNAHLPALLALQALGWPVRVKWLCDRDPSALSRAHELVPTARIASSLAEVQADPDVNAVLVLTPPAVTLDIAQGFARKGIAVFVEKPVAESHSTLAAAAAASDFDRILVGYNRRFQPLLPAARAAIASLGPLTGVQVRLWRGARTRGDFYEDVPVHAFDLLRSELGPIRLEQVIAEAPAPGSQLAARVQVDLRTTGGLLITADIRPATGLVEETYTFLSSRGTVRFGYPAMDGPRRIDGAGLLVQIEGREAVQESVQPEQLSTGDAAFMRGFVHQMAHMLELAASPAATPRCTLRDAAEALALSEAFVRQLPRP